jgi:L-iditol 2-dehydrogenase
LVVQALRAAGCGQIIAVDIDSQRLELAGKLGADVGINCETDDVAEEIRQRTDDRGADVAFEVVGISASMQTAIGSLRKGGSLILVGNIIPEVTLPLQAVVTRELTLNGSCASQGEYPACLELIARGEVNVDALLSATVPLAEGAEWFKRLYDNQEGLLKVILTP